MFSIFTTLMTAIMKNGLMMLWKFEDLGDNKTKVTWGFRSNMKKPFGGYLALFFKGSIEKNFNKGIDNLVKYTNGE